MISTEKECDYSNPNVPIAKFYEGKSIFLTGGTGFIGKLVLEKLLYSCPQIGNIYMLTRADSSEHANQRIHNMVHGSMSLFTRLKRDRPENISKIIPVVGTLGAPNLNIHADVMETLINEVSVIIHIAATIKFNETLRTAVSYNVEGTRDVLRLAKRMQKMQSFVYVSTMYSQARVGRTEIMEVLYPSPTTLSHIYKKLDVYGDMRPTPPNVLCGHKNTYTLTKALAENVLAEECDNIPVAIIRPSMVGACLNEPTRGWMDNMSLQSYYIYLAAKGFLRIMYGDENHVIDFVPADYTANMIIVAGARNNRSKKVTVYNCGTSSCNPLTFKNLFKLTTESSIQSSFNELPFPRVFFIKSKWFSVVLMYLIHIFPAYLMDIFCKITNKTPRFVEMQRKMQKMLSKNDHFTSNSWRMIADNARDLHNSLSFSDQHEFSCDPSKYCWTKYIPAYIQGIRYFYK